MLVTWQLFWSPSRRGPGGHGSGAGRRPRQGGAADAQGSFALARADDPIQAIDDEYNRQVLELGRRRLEQLAGLAARQTPAEAAATYERLFRLAIADDLFRDAESAAASVVEQGTPSAATNALAHLVKIIAETDRGAFEQSLKSFRQAVTESMAERAATPARAALAPGEVVGICEAYYQRLVEANQFPVAREAFRLVVEKPFRPAVKEFLASRLKRIDLVGKPAPPDPGNGPGRQGVQPRCSKRKSGPARVLGKLEPARRGPGRMARAGRSALFAPRA